MKKEMIYKTILLMIVLLVMVSGCSTVYTVGSEFKANNVDLIIKGKTTKSEIKELFGEPYKVGIINGKTAFTYSYQEFIFPPQSNINSVEKEGDTLFIIFDENGVVEKYYFNVPGIDPVILGVLLHKEQMRKKNESNNNQMAMQQNMMAPPIMIKF